MREHNDKSEKSNTPAHLDTGLSKIFWNIGRLDHQYPQNIWIFRKKIKLCAKKVETEKFRHRFLKSLHLKIINSKQYFHRRIFLL